MKTLVMLAVAVTLAASGSAFWGLGTYNTLVDKDEAVSAQWAQVQAAYQRRLDLVPSLVETVKGSARFERETLSEVARARAAATGLTVGKDALNDQGALDRLDHAQARLGGALSRLLVSMEKYPDLKSTEAFRDLLGDLRDAEERVAVERHNFNEVAAVYNASLRKMPAALVASRGGFTSRPYFKSGEGADRAPGVKF